MSKTYRTTRELRAVIERRLKGKLSDATWRKYKPTGRTIGFDTNDVKEIVSELRENGASIKRTIRHDTVHLAKARSSFIPPIVKQLAENWRKENFGSSKPPFTNIEDMAAWIKSKADGQLPENPDERKIILRMDNSGVNLRLAYPSSEMEAVVHIVPVFRNIEPLWSLSKIVRFIAKDLDCQEAQATGYVFTGRTPFVPSLSSETPITFRKDGPNRGKITIIIRDPVSDEELLNYYHKLRDKVWGKHRGHKPVTDRDEMLVVFARERLNRIESDKPKWDELRREFSRLYPKYTFTEWRQFKKALEGAYFKIHPKPKL